MQLDLGYERVAASKLHQPFSKKALQRNYVWRKTLDICLKLLKKNGPYEIMLEVGFAEGFFGVNALKNRITRNYVGLDISYTFVKKARIMMDKYGYKDHLLFVSDIAENTFESCTFDIVVSLAVLEHVEDPPTTVKELSNLTSKFVLLAVPLEGSWPPFKQLRNIINRVEPHRKESLTLLSPKYVLNLLNQAGLDVIEVAFFEFLPVGFLSTHIPLSSFSSMLEKIDNSFSRLFPHRCHNMVILARKKSDVKSKAFSLANLQCPLCKIALREQSNIRKCPSCEFNIVMEDRIIVDSRLIPAQKIPLSDKSFIHPLDTE